MKISKPIERKLERLALQNLTLYLVGGQGVALVLVLASPAFIGNILLIPAAVLAGEWWRLLSFVFTPPSGNPIFAAFALYLLYFMGGSLEAKWGKLRYNLYVLISFVMTIASAFLFPFGAASNVYITGSIFLAFAYLFPDYTFYLFLLLPMRVKWLALVTWLFYGYEIVTAGWETRLLILAALTNFMLFFGADIFYGVRYGHRQLKRQSSLIANRDKLIHVCFVCGVTDKSHQTMEFRYCTKCEPPVAFCMEHLGNHPHVGNDSEKLESR